MSATFTKLRSGDWGIRVQGVVKEGDTVKVVTKAGKESTVTVSKVVWSGNGVTLCAIQSDRGSRSSGRSGGSGYSPKRRTGCSCGSYEGGDGKGFDHACAQCRFDEFDC